MTQSRTKSGQVYVGSAAEDAPGSRGWLLGHFLPEDDPRHSDGVEIKRGIHPVGDERQQWVTDDHRTAAIPGLAGTGLRSRHTRPASLLVWPGRRLRHDHAGSGLLPRP